MSSMRRRMAAATSISLAGMLINLLASYPRNLFAARALGPELLGIYTLGGTVFGWVAVVLGFGINVSIAKYIGERWSDQPRLSAGVRWSIRWVLSISICGAIALIGVSYILRKTGTISNVLSIVLALYAIAIPFMILKEVASQVSISFGLIRSNVLINNIVAPIVWTLSIIFIWHFKLGLYAVTLTVPLLYVTSGLSTFFLAKKKLAAPLVAGDSFSRDQKAILISGVILLVSNFAFSVWLKLDNLFLGTFWGNREIGLYTPAYQTAFLLTYMNVAVSSFFSPTVARYLAENRLDELSALYKETSRWCYYGNLGICVTLFIGAEGYLSLFGKEFLMRETIVSLQILLVAFLIYSYAGALPWVVLSMSRRQRKLAFSEIIMIPISAIIHLIVTSRYGVVGAAISTGLSLALAGILRQVFVRGILGKVSYNRHFLSIVVSTFTSFGAGFVFAGFFRVTLVLLPVLFFVVVLVQVLTLLIMKDDSVTSLVRAVKQKLAI